MTASRLIKEIDWRYYCTTDGCYVISDNNTIIAAYQCDKEEPLLLNPFGNSLFITFLAGNMKLLLTEFINPDSALEYLIFERLTENGYKIYPFKDIKRRILNAQ